MGFIPKTAPHGDRSTYVYYQCRCGECRAAGREYAAQLRAKRYAQTKDPSDQRHGTKSFYNNFGCRCIPCTTANRAYMAAYRGSRPADESAT